MNLFYDYKLIESNYAMDLAIEVNNAIDEGYQPCGPLAVIVSPGGFKSYCQPMAKMTDGRMK
jgi:hypothetical protein